jgi:hypothetical protein
MLADIENPLAVEATIISTDENPLQSVKHNFIPHVDSYDINTLA